MGGADDLAARAAARRQADEREGAAEGATIYRAWHLPGGKVDFLAWWCQGLPCAWQSLDMLVMRAASWRWTLPASGSCQI